MDRELAGVVIAQWETGEPVSEMQLYKAAQMFDIDPVAALVEARYYTYLDRCLLEKRAMSRGERIVFSAAAGLHDGAMVKTASAYGLSPEELIVEALRERGFVPDLQKIANLAPSMMGGGPPPGGPGQKPPGPGGAQGPMDPAMMGQPPMPPDGGGGGSPEEAAGGIMMAPPSQDAMLQQDPSARIKPSPTAPDQVAASPAGNLDALVQEGQQVFGPQATDNGGTAPQGMPEPPPPPPSPDERVRQVGPNLDDETVARYAEQLQRFEEGFAMQISDPKQMVKFVKELQKVDGKKVDQGIKAMGEQLEQEQAQELGVDSNPTIDGSGGAMGGGPGTQMAPKPGMPGQPPQQSPEVGPASGSQSGMPDPQSEDGGGAVSEGPQKQQQSARPPRPQPKPAPPQQAAGAAVEKVANAARALARASIRTL